MLADVPYGRAALVMRLFHATIVVGVLEEKDAPVFLWDEIQVLEHLALFDLLYHEVDMVLGLFKVSLFSVQPDLIEVSMDNLAAELLELVKELQERLLHQLVYQSVKERVVELGYRVSDPSVNVHDELSSDIRVQILKVMHPEFHQSFELSEGVSTSHKLVKIRIEFLAELGLTLAVLASLSEHGRSFIELWKILRLSNGVQSQLLNLELDSVGTVESLVVLFRILDLLLEVSSEILVLIASKVRHHSV